MDASSNALAPSLPRSLSASTWTNGAPARLVIGAFSGLALVDALWSHAAGVPSAGWGPVLIGGGLLLGLCVFYSIVRPIAAFAELTLYSALWIGFSVSGCFLSYLAASLSRPLADDMFTAIDASLGFDWVAYADFVRGHEALNAILRAAYNSLMLQIGGSIAVFSLARIAGRNAEFLLSAMIALFMSVAVCAALPALGPWVHFGYPAQSTADMAYVADVLALRSGVLPTFTPSQAQGIVCFPSYHTALAILFIYAHRGIRWFWLPITLLNLLMLLSIPVEGGHYLTDMLGGAVVAFCAIWIGRQIHNFFAYRVGTSDLKPFHNRRHAF